MRDTGRERLPNDSLQPAPTAARPILASDVMRGLVAGKAFDFVDRGRRKLRGFDEPVRLFEVRWQD